MTKGSKAIELLTSLVASTEYQDGVMQKSKDILNISVKLAALNINSYLTDFSNIYTYLDSELRKVKKKYTGFPPAADQKIIAKELYLILINTPHEYIFYFELPSGLNIKGEIYIDNGISITTITPEIQIEIEKNNQFTYLMFKDNYFSELLKKSPIIKKEVTPNYTKLELNRYYLKVNCKGLITKTNIDTDGLDPIHIYKLLIAFLTLTNVLVLGDLLHMISDKSTATYGKESIIYKDNLEFVTTSARPIDEAGYLSALVFKNRLDINTLAKFLVVFKKLINPMKNEYLDLERNKIINSMYWYFEGERSTNISFKTLMEVSMFDSFYTTNDKQTFTVDSILDSCGYTPGRQRETQKKNLDILYKNRNDIAHGNIILMEVSRDEKHVMLRDRSFKYKILEIYNKFIEIKIEKLLA